MGEIPLVICRCNICDGNLEFERGQAGSRVACPHCGMETQLYVPNTPVGIILPTTPPPTSPTPPPSPATPPPLRPQASTATPQQRRGVKGTVLDYSIQTNTGIISGDDGIRYSFRGAEWRATGKFPTNGMRVDFVPQAGDALAIY